MRSFDFLRFWFFFLQLFQGFAEFHRSGKQPGEHIIDSMFNQHAKRLKVTARLPWRRPIASLNYLLASHVWQQMHNGFTHQDPGFIDHVVNKKASVVRVYLPPDANCLLSVWDHCLRSRHYVNVVIAGKYQAPQWLTMDAAVAHCTEGIGIWHWASSDAGSEPDARGHGQRHRDSPRTHPRISFYIAFSGERRVPRERKREPPGAMERAEKNIDELLETLHGTFHRIRQAGIDEELFDVISGFEALKAEDK